MRKIAQKKKNHYQNLNCNKETNDNYSNNNYINYDDNSSEKNSTDELFEEYENIYGKQDNLDISKKCQKQHHTLNHYGMSEVKIILTYWGTTALLCIIGILAKMYFF